MASNLMFVMMIWWSFSSYKY